MRERKVWSAQEDQILRQLREERQLRKWSAIARAMGEEFGLKGRTGKQCRERYHNHLESGIRHSRWTNQEDLSLFRLHLDYGNKWSAIAQHLPGRSENCVKNHFYSKLRKVVRRLNKGEPPLPATNSQEPPVPVALLSRIVAATEARFRPTSKFSDDWIEFATDLVGRLYHFEHNCQRNPDPQVQFGLAQTLLADIAKFQHHFRRKRGNRKSAIALALPKSTVPNPRSTRLSKKKTQLLHRKRPPTYQCHFSLAFQQSQSARLQPSKSTPHPNLFLQVVKPSAERVREKSGDQEGEELLARQGWKNPFSDEDCHLALLGENPNTFMSFCDLDEHIRFQAISPDPESMGQQPLFGRILGEV